MASDVVNHVIDIRFKFTVADFAESLVCSKRENNQIRAKLRDVKTYALQFVVSGKCCTIVSYSVVFNSGVAIVE